ncbi:MAG: hypothetical protein IPL71_22310 [Anaerolineales bacterium]|uniref:hypothetical protein n=1 Tax=Candidatus Villigracilis proximus TaxID=3140683 RepID=UPI0031366A37|nr:hypothetical protein [Anaerolineales bacterium]
MNTPSKASRFILYAVKAFSIFFTLLFVLIQFVPITDEANGEGGWCSPYLGAPVGLGHSAFDMRLHGFPYPFVTVITEKCFEARETRYEWSPIGIGVESLLLALLTYPLWAGRLKKQKEQFPPK